MLTEAAFVGQTKAGKKFFRVLITGIEVNC